MMSEKIELVLVKRKMSKSALAAALNSSPSNLYNKFKRDNWCERELREIARVLDCKLEYNFVLNDSGEKF